MSNKFWRIGWSMLFFLLASCTFAVSATDPLHLTVEVAPAFKTDGRPDPQPTVSAKPEGQPAGQAPSQPHRYIALNALASASPVSATAVLTTHQLLITRNVITPLQSIGLFTPLGKIRLAIAHPFRAGESVTQTLLSATEWVLLLPADIDPNIQSWEQILITPSIRSNAQGSLNLAEMQYSLRHMVREVIPFDSQAAPTAALAALDSALTQWSSAHPGQALWVDLVITEEKFSDGTVGLVLYRFVDRGANPIPEDEKVYYCTVQLACGSADSAGEVLVCWWNGC